MKHGVTFYVMGCFLVDGLSEQRRWIPDGEAVEDDAKDIILVRHPQICEAKFGDPVWLVCLNL